MNCKPAKGKVVLYVHKIDTDPSEVPNVSPAIVTKVEPDGGLHLHAFHQKGDFIVEGVKQGDVEERGTWHWPH